ncbi:MAG: casein kinase I-like protein [Amphiamblys sp. WSBS2006]|nr:MAG: casein kinase I-like protein [Amphiamblys sp. WSBS2006]
MSKEGPVLQNGRYVLRGQIGKGSFGVIYEGYDVVRGVRVALKFEKTECEGRRLPHLEHEYRVYCCLKNTPGIAEVNELFRLPNYLVLVMECLGPSLADLFRAHRNIFSLKTVLFLAEKILCRLEYLHLNHYVHQDIKPDNFTVGAGEKKGEVYLIDFGLARRYRDPASLQHISSSRPKGLIGTARYASRRAHLGETLSRGDDLEAVGYLLVYFAKGALPWQGLRIKEKAERDRRIWELKERTGPEELCADLPPCFCTYLLTVRRLGLDERPDYKKLRGLFYEAMRVSNVPCDYVFDWDAEK